MAGHVQDMCICNLMNVSKQNLCGYFMTIGKSFCEMRAVRSHDHIMTRRCIHQDRKSFITPFPHFCSAQQRCFAMNLL